MKHIFTNYIFTKINILGFFLIIFLTSNTISKKSLRFTFQMFRHGARSPFKLDSNNKDIYGHKWQGKGELTEVGMRQQYLLGYRNRKIYGERLNINKFDTKEIYIISTRTNRTIESAYSLLTGFFPPGTGETLTENQIQKAFPPYINPFNFTSEIQRLGSNVLPDASNVFPINNFNNKKRNFDLQKHQYCKGAADLWNNRNENPILKNFTKNLQEKYQSRLYNIIGKSKLEYDLNIYDNLLNLFDSFIAGYTDGRNFPKILENNITIEEYKSLAEEFLYIDIFNFCVPNNFTGLYSMSPLMKTVLEKMESRISIDNKNINIDKYENKNPKMYLVSAHDTNIGSLMVFMNEIFKTGKLFKTTYASSIYLELESDNEKIGDDKWNVNFLLNDQIIFSIKYKDFMEKINSRLISTEEINNYCQFEEFNNKYNNDNEIILPFLIVNIILGFGVLVMGFLVGYSVLANK
jgi:hypothetical protein